MIRTLIAPTSDSIVAARTTLEEDALKGDASPVAVTDAGAAAAGSIAVIGLRGTDGAELVRLADGGSGVIEADLLNAHAAGEPVEVLRYDSRRFYGSAAEGGTYALIATVPIVADDPQGTAYEYSGPFAFFKATYFDSVGGDETALADSDAEAGDQSAHYATVDGIRKRARMAKAGQVQDDTFKAARVRAENEIDGSLISMYVLPLAEVPEVVTEICLLLAAGAVRWDEFGEEGGGQKMQSQARSMLKDVRAGAMNLIGASGTELQRVGSSLPSFFPDAASHDDRTDPTKPRMPRNKKY